MKVLVEGGRNQDSHLTRLYGYRDRMPVFGLAYLHDAYRARGAGAADSSAQIADLRRRMANAILTEAGSSHVEELSDPYLLYFWNSNVRTTSIVLNSLVKGDVADAPVRQLVRWMMAARKDGRWGNTQENALAMEALVAYYRKFEGVVPDFRAVVRLGSEDLVNESFTGRTTTSKTKEVPLSQILARNAAGTVTAADLRPRGVRDALLCLASALRAGRDLPRWTRQRNPRCPLVRAVRRERDQAGSDNLQGRRSDSRHAVVRADEGASFRCGYRSASGRPRTRRVVVCDDRGIAGAKSGRSG